MTKEETPEVTEVPKILKEPRSECYYYALKYISRYPKTEKELSVKLMEKGYTTRDIEYAIKFLKSKNFMGDRMFTELYIQSELIRKGKPKMVVQNKLYHKGVDKYLIQEIFQELEEEIQDGIGQKIQKHIDKMKAKDIEGFDIIQKLLVKGYTLDQVKYVIKGKED